jgi:hypothetical protein
LRYYLPDVLLFHYYHLHCEVLLIRLFLAVHGLLLKVAQWKLDQFVELRIGTIHVLLRLLLNPSKLNPDHAPARRWRFALGLDEPLAIANLN